MCSRTTLFLLALMIASSGCRDAKVESYRVPRETPEPLPPILTGTTPATDGKAQTPAPGGDMASTPVRTADGNALTWSAPSHWKPKAASAMRKGSYTISGPDNAEADMAITAFPGDVGGTLANVNRWRGQLQLPPVTDADLGTVTTHLDIGNLHVDVVEFANSASNPPQRMIGAIVPFEGATWFFKLTGPDTIVAQEKTAFMDFLKTIKTPTAR
jgi:hypothetical protein